MFFAISVALAVYSGEWIEFRDLLIALVSSVDLDQVIDVFNLNVLIPSTGATSVSVLTIIIHMYVPGKHWCILVIK